MSAFDRLRNQRKSEFVLDQIIAAIDNGDYKVGDALPSEEMMAKEMGVSRSTVREAITALRLQGIVDTQHGEGSVVRKLATLETGFEDSKAVLHQERLSPFDIHVVREQIEPSLAELAAENVTTEQIASIRASLESMEQQLQREDFERCFFWNIRFHFAVMEATNNDVAVDMLRPLYHAMSHVYENNKIWRQILTEYHSERESCHRCLLEHRAIADAVVAGDPIQVRESYIAHFQRLHCHVFNV